MQIVFIEIRRINGRTQLANEIVKKIERAIDEFLPAARDLIGIDISPVHSATTRHLQAAPKPVFFLFCSATEEAKELCKAVERLLYPFRYQQLAFSPGRMVPPVDELTRITP